MPLRHCDMSSHEGRRDMSQESFPPLPGGRQPRRTDVLECLKCRKRRLDVCRQAGAAKRTRAHRQVQDATDAIAKFSAAFDKALREDRFADANRLLAQAKKALPLNRLPQDDRAAAGTLFVRCRKYLGAAAKDTLSVQPKPNQPKAKKSGPKPAKPKQVKNSFDATPREPELTGVPPLSLAPTSVCLGCGRFFHPPTKHSRRQRCETCYREPGSSVKTISGGLPGLGRRR
jgi:hypothetical protein